MATRSTNTMNEGLKRMLAEISDMKTAPDANLDFLVALETGVLGFLRAPMEQAMSGMGAPGMGGPPPPQMMPAGGAPQMGPSAPSMPMPSAGGGGAPQPGLVPSADELRRLMQ